MKNLNLRVFSLVLLIVLLNSWTTTHLGKDLRHMALINLCLAFVALLSSVASYLSDDEKKSSGRILSHIVYSALNKGVLITLWLLFLLASLLISSVTIQSRTSPSPDNARLFRLNPMIKTSHAKPLKIKEYLAPKTVIVNPFGTTFMLSVNGYQNFTFQVYPLLPKRIVIEENLTRTPSVFIRMSEDIQENRFVYTLLITNRETTIYDGDIGLKGAFLLGIKQRIPDDIVQQWQLGLKSRDDIPNEKELYKQLKLWIIDTTFIKAELHPLDTLTIKILNPARTIVSSTDYQIGFDVFQDYLLKLN